MRFSIPDLGERDLREFTFHSELLPRPEGDAWNEEWHDYLHLRDNPAGEVRELWYHGPSGTFLVITRNRATHEVIATELAEAAHAD